MNGCICRNCSRCRMELMETVLPGTRKNPPERMVMIRMLCGNEHLASEHVGMPEYVNASYALYDQPYSNIISRSGLSKQMEDDYDNAISRASGKLDDLQECFIPDDCPYAFEHEISKICMIDN